MCQLTTPPPSYEQVWNWKLNIEGGLAPSASKRSQALAYLGQAVGPTRLAGGSSRTLHIDDAGRVVAQ
jgi:hypothetical protein